MYFNIPCNVGDYVYRINLSTNKIETKKVSSIQIHIGKDNRHLMHIEFAVCGFCRDTDFGKTIFMNRVDALHALEKRLSGMKA